MAVSGAAERAKHWTEFDERGAEWGPASVAFAYRTLGRGFCLFILAPTIFFFYLSGARQRRASLDYLTRVRRAQGRAGKPSHWDGLKHFYAFGVSMLDKYAAWIGHIKRKDVDEIDAPGFDEMRADPRGAIIISAHFGAIEIIRAIAARDQRRRINVVIHTKNARAFNNLIARFAPHAQVALVEATEFDVSTAVELSAAVERGEWVVIMGDRMPASRNNARTVPVQFLGDTAHFPQGPFLLAAALRCPTYLIFCYKAGGRHRVHLSLFSKGVHVQRRNRMVELQALIERYARVLEDLVKAAPGQWFNYYEFWARPAGERGDKGRDVDH